jgi:hypothetical protein
MKLLMLIVDEARKEEIEIFLNRAGVVGYTEIPHAVGVGTTGPRLGSRAFPKTSAVIFTVVEAAAVDALERDLKVLCEDCGEKLKAIVWGVEGVL